MQSCTKDEFNIFKSKDLIQLNDKDEELKVALTPVLTNNDYETIADVNNAVVNQWVSLFLQLERYALGMRPNASGRAIVYFNLRFYFL